MTERRTDVPCLRCREIQATPETQGEIMREFTYPSIAGPGFAFLDTPCIAFEKYDGSNLRFFWDNKRGWHSTGTRYRWFKPQTPIFGAAVELFQRHYAKSILDTVRRFKEYRGITELVAFCEFFGPQTFSGLHGDTDPKEIVLFDIYLPQRGFVPPRDFVAHFGHLPIAKVIYEGAFSRDFIDGVQRGDYPVAEGVVAKGIQHRRSRKGSPAEVWMAKVKTKAWLDELARRAGSLPKLQKELEENRREQQNWSASPEPSDSPGDDETSPA